MGLERLKAERILEDLEAGRTEDDTAQREICRVFGDHELRDFVRRRADDVTDGRLSPHRAAREIETEEDYWDRRRRRQDPIGY